MPSASRDDITPKVVADLYLTGLSILKISTQLDAEPSLIQARLKRARVLYPDLPWAERKATRGTSATLKYIHMKDGVIGKSDVAGSIARARKG